MGERNNSIRAVSEQEARRVAEEARETEWQAPSFLKEIFLGNFRLDLVHPFPEAPPERPEFRAFYDRMERFLLEQVDSDAIDREGKIPPRVVEGLARMGAFGMKIPKEYGGLGFTQCEYARGHQAHLDLGRQPHRAPLGAPVDRSAAAAEALRNEGAEGEVLPAPGARRRLRVRADGGGRRLRSGEPLDDRRAARPKGTTSSTARSSGAPTARSPSSSSSWRGTPDTGKISAFIVEKDWPGVEVVQRCHFMGLKAIENGVIRFTNVRVPKENLLLGRGAAA